MRSFEHSASFYLFLAKKQRKAGDFFSAYAILKLVRDTRAFRVEMQKLLLAVNSVALDEKTQFAAAVAWQFFAIQVLEEESDLFGDETPKILSFLRHQREMLLLAAHADEISGQEWLDEQINILISMTADLIANTPSDDQAANLVMILDLNRMSARLVGQEDDPEWYRTTYLDLAAVAKMHGLFELQARLFESSNLYADFIKETTCPLLFARQSNSRSAARGSRKLQKLANALQERRLFSRGLSR